MGSDATFEGVKVLELGAGAAGPVATRYFGDRGATVIRVESRKRPDFLRLVHYTKDNPFGLDGAPMFVLMNPNKRSISINMSTSEGVALVKRLIGWADIVSENFSPRAMVKWGLDYASLEQEFPDLIMLSSCLFGQTGPQRMYPGFGGQGSAISGFNHLTGWPDRAAVGPSGTITDSLSPRYVACLIASALLHRRRTGEGQYIDVSQIETAVYSLSEMIVRHSASGEVMTRRGNDDEVAAPHALFPCAGEDRWIAIAVWSDDEWRRLCSEMGAPELASDERYRDSAGRHAHRRALEARIGQWTADYEPHPLMERLQAAGIEAGAVQDFDDLLADPQLAARRHFEPLEHVHLGRLSFERDGIRLGATDQVLRTPGPNLGEHTAAIARDILGLADDEVCELIEREVLV